jgi:hypothetical protein
MLATFALAVLGASSRSAPVFPDPKPFVEYDSFEGMEAAAAIPDDWQVPGELVIGRLMYPSAGGGGDWHYGNTGWTDDYPRGDRALIKMIKRNTRINVRSVEQPVPIDDLDEMSYYPLLVAGMAYSWNLSEREAGNLREYLLRGGFLFCDSFFQENNWYAYEDSMKRVFPEYEIWDLTDDEAVFHIAFDMKEMTKVAIPHISTAFGGGGMGLTGPPHWRGVFENNDPKRGRLLVLIAHNNDTGDGWQFADDPRYPADEANRALRLGSNVAIYSMTH